MKVTVVINDAAVRAMVGGFNARLWNRLAIALDRFTTILQRRVKEKLSDDVLHVRTGTLRRSINKFIRRTVSGVDATVGTNVVYASVHEYGFQGTVTVREHTRQSSRHGHWNISRNSKSLRFVRGEVAGGPVTVRAHSRNMNVPARSFLRTSLAELQDEALSEIRGAVREAMRP